MNLKKTISIVSFLILLLIISCKDSKNNTDSSFKLIPRNSYFSDSYGEISIYRDNKTRQLMNGYYVVGNKDVKWEEFNVKDGVLNGSYIIFHKNGNIFSHSKYLNGKLHGEEKTYSLSGALSKVSNYSNGVRYGKNISYFNNGQIRSESKIKNDKIIESVTYDLIGNITSQMFIKEGIKISQQIKGGKIYTEELSSTYDDFEAMKFYNEDGTVKAFFRMVDEDDNSYLIELDENKNEIKRINVKANPQEAIKYMQLMQGL